MDYRNIGKLVAVFGLQGELILQHRLGKKSPLKGLKAIFLEDKKDEFLPWFVEQARIKGTDELYLKLEGINDPESARKLVQKQVWLPAADLTRYAASTAPISLLGYQLWQGEECLGEILEVIEQPHQVLCRIDLGRKEALIPIHEGTLQRIDRNKHQVHVILPDGLLDIYR